MPKIEIDGQVVELQRGATVLEGCMKLGIDIPTMCFLDGLEHFTSCMLCVVLDKRSGKLLPSCSAPAVDGMVIDTCSEEVRSARRAALELLLSDHLGDCEAPCRRTCPAGMDIPTMIRQIAAGRPGEALETVKKDIALPAVLGRICPAPCEKACRRGRLDEPVSICNLKRYVADTDLASASRHVPECGPDTGRQVAIVGAGPTGLAAAYYLRGYGHGCVVFDKQSAPGGALRSGVPEDRLPRDVLDAEIDVIRRLGTVFRTDTHVGTDITMSDLRREYDAVVLAVGPIAEQDGMSYGVGMTERGIAVESRSYMTGEQGVFAGGAAVGGGRKLAVKSVADGRALASAVDQMLRGTEVMGMRRRFNSVLGRIREEEFAEFMKGAAPGGRIGPAIGAPGGLSADAAAGEAARCLHCDCRKPDSCRLRRYADEYEARQDRYKGAGRRTFLSVRQHASVIYEPGKCIACGICVRITEREREPLGLSFIGRGFAVRVGVPFSDSLADALGKTAERCAGACPTGALSHVSGEGGRW